MDWKLKLGNWLAEKANILITKSNIAKHGKQIGRVNKNGDSVYERGIRFAEHPIFRSIKTVTDRNGKPFAYVRSTDMPKEAPSFSGTVETTFLGSNSLPTRIVTSQRATNVRYTTILDVNSGNTSHIKVDKNPLTGNITLNKWKTNRMGTVLGSQTKIF